MRKIIFGVLLFTGLLASSHLVFAQTANTTPLIITRPLYLGVIGDDVSALQQFLKDKGYFTYPEITKYFGTFTQKAVIDFQGANGFEQVGNVGPLTRAKIAELTQYIASSSQPAVPQSTSTLPIITPPFTQIWVPDNGYTPGFGGGGPVAVVSQPISVPTPYLDTGVISPVSSSIQSVDNGMYDVLVEGATSQWKRIFVQTGSYTATPANADTVLTRARFWGPYSVTPNTSTPLGLQLLYGTIFNSQGLTTYGATTIPSRSITIASTVSLPLSGTSQGLSIDDMYYYLNTHTAIYKYTKAGVLVAQNLSPFSSMSGSYNHMGGSALYNNYLYVGAVIYNSPVGSNQHIAVYNASDLSYVTSFDVSAGIGTGDLAGLAIDSDARIIYAADYDDSTIIRRFNLDTGAVLTPLTIPSAQGTFQGITFKNNLLYLSASRNAGSSGAPVIAVINTSGTPVAEYLLPTVSGEREDIAFDGSSIVMQVQGSPDVANYFTLPSSGPTYGKGGWLGATDWAFRATGLKMGTDYAIFTQLVPTSLPSVSSIWDNSSNSNDHEGWWDSVGRVRGRAASADTTSWSGPISPGVLLTYGWSYNHSTGAKALYVNGQNRATGTDTPTVAWPAAGDLGIGGEHPSNSRIDGRVEVFYAFKRSLTEAEMQSLQTNPGIVWSPTNALTDQQKASLP